MRQRFSERVGKKRGSLGLGILIATLGQIVITSCSGTSTMTEKTAPATVSITAPTRIAPGDGTVTVDWIFEDHSHGESSYQFVIQTGPRSKSEWSNEMIVGGVARSATITGLENGRDYLLRISARRADTKELVAEGPVRIITPGGAPGVVINYIHKDDTTYASGRSTASPSIVILPNGSYLASHDIYWSRYPQNLSMIFRSDDRGQAWRFVTELEPCFWGKLFWHRGRVYMLSTTGEYGSLVIRGSDDEGETWSAPTEIMPSGTRQDGGPHKAPVPVMVHGGRLWTGVERGSWSRGGHDAGVISAPVDADLLNAKNWTVSEFLPARDDWPGGVPGGRVLEGNVVFDVGRGELVNILRYSIPPKFGKAVILRVNTEDPAAMPEFRRVIDFYGGMSKFTIRYDPVSRRYWSLVNRVTKDFAHQRNVLTLVSSPDLDHWEIERDVLDYADADAYTDRRKDMKIGFQYVDWQFEGDDLVAVSRTAFNGANNYHDANHLTFHRVVDFRASNL